jgi:CubicO group peptidase (beta-lactamase class C family)
VLRGKYGSVAMTVEGTCAAGFERVRDALAENFAQGGEVGATVAATVDGKLVVDLWAGHADAAGRVHGRATRSWTSRRRPRA